ncbi:hypothetical protein PLICRDRAFT_112875 [Plicaturopsis crispa FD-325 SS-3]|nr:hypothetical protein PLICRDRAFT_112875 [Plicaturopsis crispa FD-325 SS-3]
MHSVWQVKPTRLRCGSCISHFSTSSSCLARRAIVFARFGDPSEVISSVSLPSLPLPGPDTINIEFTLAPINPSDINVIEGVYPSRPSSVDSLSATGRGSPEEPVFIAGNEGLAKVVHVGSGVSGLQKDDWVVMRKQQGGTWVSSNNVRVDDVLKIPRGEGDNQLSEVNAATMNVNPATAYNMLHDFADLKAGEWVLQNGANSAVGQAVIQIAASKGIKTINLVRNRENFESLKTALLSYGGTQVLTYDDLTDKATRSKVMEWTGGKDIRLGLNCVGGKETTLMARLLGHNAHLVSYGAMSKQPFSLPTSLFIFKNLTSHGFWQSRWYQDHSLQERIALIQKLTELMTQGKVRECWPIEFNEILLEYQLREPEHEIVVIEGSLSDEEATTRIRSTIAKMTDGRQGKKVLLKVEDPVD